jgi:hypothetical protein
VFSPVVFYFRFRGALDGQTAMALMGSLQVLSLFIDNNPKEIRRNSHQRRGVSHQFSTLVGWFELALQANLVPLQPKLDCVK